MNSAIDIQMTPPNEISCGYRHCKFPLSAYARQHPFKFGENTIFESECLILRPWTKSDYPKFAELNSDTDVMRYFPAPLTTQESNALADRLSQLIDQNGYGLWAAELKKSSEFIGFVGLNNQTQESGIPYSPLLEISWRLAREYWGQGLATEAAKCALNYAFTQLGASEVYAFTALKNAPSQRVMHKIGMTNTGLNFDHPKLADGHELQRHCLFKIARQYPQQTF